MSRLAVRALLVLGGAVAATVIGWLVTSATASADILPVPPVASVVDTLTATAGPVKPADLPARPDLPATPITLSDGVRGVTGALKGAVRQLGDPAPVDRTVVAPALTALSPTTPMSSATAGQSGSAGGRTPATPLPGSAATAPAPAPSGTATARHTVRPPAGRSTPASPTVAAVPTPPAPWPPAGPPSAPGGTAAPGAGGIGLVDTTGTVPAATNATVRFRSAAARPRQLLTRRQPGITPD